MNILITTHERLRRKYFPPHVMEAYQQTGNVVFNEGAQSWTEQELIERIKDIDICVTHWDRPNFNEEVLKNAPHLKLIAHAASSVGFLTDLVYEKGIKVCSAHKVMAKYVAEGTLTYILSALRRIPVYDRAMKEVSEKWWQEGSDYTLMNRKIGLVGLGMIGRFLLDFLKPFDVKIKLYDPYVSPDSLKEHSNIELCSLEEVLSWADIISIHAAKTPETFHMLNADRMKLIKDNALLVNTARGSLIDTDALINELKKERFVAVLDVYEQEPLPTDSPLRQLKNTVLMPHKAGAGSPPDEYALVVLEEIKRFMNNEQLLHEVPYNTFKLMTK